MHSPIRYRSKKILFLADVPLSNPVSGSEQVLHKQATSLSKQGASVYAITRQNAVSPAINRTVEGVREICYGADIRHAWRFVSTLLFVPAKLFDTCLDNASFHAAVCHQPFTLMSLLMRRRLRSLPVLYNFHSPSHEEYLLSHKNRNFIKNYFPMKARKWAERHCLLKAKKIMVLSQFMKNRIHAIHKIPFEKIVINPGGVDTDRFAPPGRREYLKRRLQFPENCIHLFTLRNLEPRMGLDNLLDGIKILRQKRYGVHLILGGEGPERENLETRIRMLHLENDVTMTGFISSDQLPLYYGAADFFILPTRELEGFGLVTVEALACGTPALGTPVGGTKEILSGFGTQFLFEKISPESMAEGILKGINKYFYNKTLYENLRDQCRKYAAENYSWQRHVAKLASMIDELVPPERS